ncbi:hypothetical protein JW905_11440 [bacterium]|nr:hypothetical protein [candidate division CSSED10-310 bacterium]
MPPSRGSDRLRPPRLLVCEPYLLFEQLLPGDIAVRLRDRLAVAGNEVDIVRLPLVRGSERDITRQLTGWRLLDLTASYNLPIDGVISLGFPAYYVINPVHICWLLAPGPHLDDQAAERLGPATSLGAGRGDHGILAGMKLVPGSTELAITLADRGLEVEPPVPPTDEGCDYITRLMMTGLGNAGS